MLKVAIGVALLLAIALIGYRRTFTRQPLPSGARLDFQPEGGWPAATQITVELSTEITDLAGNRLVKIQSINFTTAASK